MARELLIHNGKLNNDLDANHKTIKNLEGFAVLDSNGKVPVAQLPDIGGKFLVVQTLPSAAAADAKAIYLVPRAESEAGNIYDEYVVVEGDGGTKEWEKIGSTDIDLSGYYQKPSGGIPKTDLSAGVQASLDKADSALQNSGDQTLSGGSLTINKVGPDGDVWLQIKRGDQNGLALCIDGFLLYNHYISLPSASGILSLLSDIYDAIEQIAPAWSRPAAIGQTGATYTKDISLCTYNGVLYQCANTYTTAINSKYPPDDIYDSQHPTNHWIVKKVSELFLPRTGGIIAGDLTITTALWLHYLNSSEFGGDVFRFKRFDDATDEPYDVMRREDLALKAPLESPVFTGRPTAPDIDAQSTDGQVANKKYVDDSVAGATPNLDYVMRVDPETGGIYYTTPDTNA